MIAKHKIKDVVWKYLNKQFKKDLDIIKLTEDEIYEDLKSKKIAKDEIQDALNDLLSERSIVKKNISFGIYLPSDKTKSLPEQFKRYIVLPFIAQLVMGWYLIFIFFSIPPVTNWYEQNVKLNSILISLSVSIILSIIAYPIGGKFLDGLELLFKKLNLLKEYTDLVYPTLTLLLICSAVYIPYVLITQDLNFGHVLTILGISIGGGITWGVGKPAFLKFKKKKSKK